MKYEHILGNAMDMNDSPTKIAISWYSKTLGGFPIEIKAKIWYLYLMMLLSYFIIWNILPNWGGFPIKIKTKIRYLMISYILLSYFYKIKLYLISTKNKISYFGFNSNQIST